ncbi:MAG: hypothetical protein JWP86_968 [Phenylobacterium sp.]|nr:hypothetical protein [Phenylobacterium sp.]
MGGRSTALAWLVMALASLTSAAAAAEACHIGRIAELPTSMNGMQAEVSVKVEGVETTFMVDSGAFYSFMSPETAKRFKLSTFAAPFGFYVTGVGGSDNRIDVATVRTFGLGTNNIPNVRFLVLPGIGWGTAGVLGQNVLSVFDTEYDLGNGVIRLMKPSPDCANANLAYWAASQAVGIVDLDRITPQDPHLRGKAMINGQTITVTFDTGASTSVLKRSTAERLGFRRDAAEVRAGGAGGGIGRRVLEYWIAPFESFEIGGEKIQHTELRVADVDLPKADMLLGADFFLSHRIYVSRQQRRLYFTYNGGRVFRLDQPLIVATAPAAAAAPPAPAPNAKLADVPAEYANTPTDAAGFVRRGQASMSRRDFASATADFGRAVDLEPKAPGHYVQRAYARLGAGQPVLAMADFDQALALKPDDPDALLGRGELYLSRKDVDRAQADFDAAIKAAPAGSAVGMAVGSLYAQAGLFPRALAAYDAWIAAHPKGERLGQALNSRCWARTLSGKDLPLALADCEAAMRRGPRDAALYDSRGLVNLRMGRLDQAIADYNDALRLQPRLAWSLYGRGVAKIAKGQKAEGEADIQAATATGPDVPVQARRYGIAPPGPATGADGRSSQ